MNNIQDISSYTPKKNDIFLLDTNVLIKIFYPALGAHNSAPYINFYEKILKSNSKVLLSSVQLSEFVNRCIRFQFDLYRQNHPEVQNFKEDYRNTEDYKSSMDAILEIIEHDIFPVFTRINDNFELLNPQNLLMHSFSYDFNDAVIAEISRHQQAFLVTDDRDYVNYLNKLNIITKNRALLMFRSRK